MRKVYKYILSIKFMKVIIQCDIKEGGCGAEYEVEAENIKEKYIQCCVCGIICLNPFYKEK